MIYHCKKCGWSGEVTSKPHCLPCYAKAMREWRAKNPEKYKAQKARWAKRMKQERPDYYRQRRRKYYLPATGKRQRVRREAWLKAGDVTKAQLLHIVKIWQGCCAYCGKRVETYCSPLHLRGFDHVTSRAQGGKHTASNIVVCCRACNEAKQ